MIENLKNKLNEKGEIYFRVKACPGMFKTEIKLILEDGTIKINIGAKMEKGAANAELIRFLAELFGVKKNNVRIVSGKTSRIKLLKIIRHKN